MMIRNLCVVVAVLASIVSGERHRRKTRHRHDHVDDYGLRQVEFAKRHGEFLLSLDDSLVRKYETTFRKGAGPVRRTETPRIKWHPVQCHLLGLDLSYQKTIHSGRRNSVFLLKDKVTGKKYAYKTFAEPDEYTAELAVSMILADHPTFVQPICIKGYKLQQDDILGGIVFEYVEGPSSDEYVQDPNVTYKDVKRMSAQLLEAMEYMHYQGYIHADLKPANVMVTRAGNIKVIDFGFALRLPYVKGNRGTATTMAPELIQAVKGPIHEGVDWWAYGSTVAMWNSLLLTRTKRDRFVPLLLDRSASTFDRMFGFGECPDAFPQELRAFLALFFQANPDKRIFNTTKQTNFLRAAPYLSGCFK